jgi:hypothetical protein
MHGLLEEKRKKEIKFAGLASSKWTPFWSKEW